MLTLHMSLISYVEQETKQLHIFWYVTQLIFNPTAYGVSFPMLSSVELSLFSLFTYLITAKPIAHHTLITRYTHYCIVPVGSTYRTVTSPTRTGSCALGPSRGTLPLAGSWCPSLAPSPPSRTPVRASSRGKRLTPDSCQTIFQR